MAQKIWEFEGDWYIQPEGSLPICMNTKEAAQDYLDCFSIPIEPPVMQTNMGYWCEECKTICATYEQGLSCSCDNRWETEVLDPEDYPKKWKKVKVNICSA